MNFRTLLNELRLKDADSYAHSVRVGLLSKVLALNIGKSEVEANRILDAATMHDIGKIQISERTLKNTSPLTQGQWNEIHMHPIYGAAIAKELGEEGMYDAAYYHHVHYRGGGYPEQKKTRNAIPEIGRIVAICDVFDALTAKRCYRPAMSITQAKEIMDKDFTDGRYDPMMYRIFWVKVVPAIYGKAAAH